MADARIPTLGPQAAQRAAVEGNLLAPEVLENPHPFYARLRETAPVYPVPGTSVHLVTSRPLIEEALEREEDFSANLTGVLMTGADGRPAVFDLASLGGTVDAIANADEPSHAVHRKLVLPQVTPKIIAGLEPTLREWAQELMQPLLQAGRGDWIHRVANPLPTRAMAYVVGLPLEDVDRLLRWAMLGTQILAGTTTSERMGEVAAKTGQMAVYLAQHMERALAAAAGETAPGVIGELVTGVREGLIAEKTAVSILVVLVGAGGESTSSLTGSSVRILAEQPTLQDQLRRDPSLIPAFVEEAVRLEPSFLGHYRAVKRATRLGGVDLPEGSHIMLMWAAANRDPEQFERPDAVDLQRPNGRDHLSFGRGTHFCVGARLARLEVRVILEELLGASRSFELDPERPPEYVKSIFVRRHAQLGLLLH
ncbi:MAG: cytochrome P450 [Deltaproteobacteria bacterium]|nr:cytochrome P450 [Deltaproteobacteria bacterium]